MAPGAGTDRRWPPAGDLIVAIDGEVIRDFSDLLSHLLKETEVGQEIIVTVLRRGERLDIPATLDPRP